MIKKPGFVLGCIALLGVIAIVSVITISAIRRDHRKPNQHWDQYWAVREPDVWSIFGVELYAQNRIAVYDMTDRTTENLPEPLISPSVQIRRFGKIAQGDDQFNLGEGNYRRDACIAFIRNALAKRGIDDR
jgi:hypothetical protein